jgi:glycine/D-amino acid oxidase-like deaminating enzyme
MTFALHPQRIVILGGGTAGWLAAALLSRKLGPRASITLVESAEIGTIGVGEGTFPTIRTTLASLGVREADFMTASDATFKQGVMFDGWKSGADSYFHPFNLPYGGSDPGLLPYWLAQKGDRSSYADAVTAQERVARAGLGPKRQDDPDFGGPMNYAYHFDAVRFAGFLRGVATANGVQRVEATISDVDLHEDGDIAALRLPDDRRLEGDFFLDCSGFGSRLIGRELGARFVGVGDVLFNDRALAIQVPYYAPETPIRPYTLATAQPSGWTWDIGLNARRGIGYVYSSSHSSDDEAADVLRLYLDKQQGEIVPRQLRFETGYREQQWIGNCAAVGLSAGFFEPLESTGISLIEYSLLLLVEMIGTRDRDAREGASRRFNMLMRERFERIIDFLKLHYCITQRTDTAYWRDNADAASIPQTLLDRLAQWHERPPGRFDFDLDRETFLPASYQYILYGMGFGTTATDLTSDANAAAAQAAFGKVREAASGALRHLPDHRTLLNHLARKSAAAH